MENSNNAILKTGGMASGTEMTLGTHSTITRLSEGGNCIYTAGSPEAKPMTRTKRNSMANNN